MDIQLESGAKLMIALAPFKDAKELYQAALDELKSLKLDPQAEIDANFYKDIFCVGLSSKKIEAALLNCMKRCTYNGEKITEELFEDEKKREDYIIVCFHVLEQNIKPFTKALSQQYKAILQRMNTLLA
jgi:hypothetical protein